MLEIPIEDLKTPPVMHISILPDFILDLQTTSLIGSVAKLQDIPKIEQLIAGRLRAFITSRWAFPRSKALKLPDLSPRSAQDADDDSPEDEDGDESASSDISEPSPEESDIAPASHDADHDSMHLNDDTLHDMQHHADRLEQWRSAQPASFIGHQYAYTPPWGPGSPLFSPNPSLANSTRARQPAAVSRSASDFLLPGQIPAGGVRYRRPHNGISSPLRNEPSPLSISKVQGRHPSTSAGQSRGQRQRSGVDSDLAS